MFRMILGTSGANLLKLTFSFMILILSTHYLGSEGYGTVSLIILSIAIIMMLNELACGSALVYFASRKPTLHLWVLSIIWVLLNTFIATSVLHVSGLVPAGYELHTGLLALILGISSVHMHLLLGKEKVMMYNVINVLQVLSLFFALLIQFKIAHLIHVNAYVYALYVSYSCALILGFFFLLPYLKAGQSFQGVAIYKDLLGFGIFTQMANIFQLLNRRLVYYLIEIMLANGRAALGVFSAAMQLAEGLWLVSKSIALVQFSRISNTRDKKYAVYTSLLLLKFSFLITLLMLLIVFCIPSSLFVFVLGDDFEMVKLVLILLSPGILFVSSSLILSHFFSGTGTPKYNTIATLLGLICTLLLGFLLVPVYEIVGAALTVSTAFIVSTIYQLLVFLFRENIRLADLLIKHSDMMKARELIFPGKRITGTSAKKDA